MITEATSLKEESREKEPLGRLRRKNFGEGRKPKPVMHGSQRGEDFMKKAINSFKGGGEVKENAD